MTADHRRVTSSSCGNGKKLNCNHYADMMTECCHIGESNSILQSPNDRYSALVSGTVTTIYFNFRDNTDFSVLKISRYKSNISTLQMIHTFMIYFVVWSVRKTQVILFRQRIVSNSNSGLVIYGPCSHKICCATTLSVASERPRHRHVTSLGRWY